MRKKYIYYNMTMALLSLVVLVILSMELILNLDYKTAQVLYFIDFAIWIIFVIDYFSRLYKSRNKKKFIKRHIIDLISIIPFYSIFRVFRALKLIRLTRLSKLTKVVRLFTVYKKSKKNFDIFIKTNNFNYTLIIAIGILILGSILLSIVEKISIQDSLWWGIVTVTTVGYGDIYPKTSLGRIIAALFMIMGIGLIGSLTSTISTYFINKKEKINRSNIKEEYKTHVIEDIASKLKDFDKLSKEDIKVIYNILISLKDN